MCKHIAMLTPLALLASLDPEFDISRLNTLLAAGSNRTEASLESILDALRKIFPGNSITRTPIGDVSDSASSRLAIYGNAGNDTLFGGAGNDTLNAHPSHAQWRIRAANDAEGRLVA